MKREWKSKNWEKNGRIRKMNVKRESFSNQWVNQGGSGLCSNSGNRGTKRFMTHPFLWRDLPPSNFSVIWPNWLSLWPSTPSSLASLPQVPVYFTFLFPFLFFLPSLFFLSFMCSYLVPSYCCSLLVAHSGSILHRFLPSFLSFLWTLIDSFFFLFFFFFLFYQVHGGLDSLEYTITAGAIPLSVLGLLIFTGSTVGRLFCGWACPIGMLQDFIAYLPFKKSRVDPNSVKYYKDVKWALLGFSILSAVLVAFRRAENPTSNPAGVFSDSFFSVISPSTTLFAYLPFLVVWKSHALVDAGFVAILKFSFLIFAFLPAIYIPRFFCRYLCPLGALLSPFGSFKFLRISRSNTLAPATLNKTLEDVCPMGVVASGVCFFLFFSFLFSFSRFLILLTGELHQLLGLCPLRKMCIRVSKRSRPNLLKKKKTLISWFFVVFLFGFLRAVFWRAQKGVAAGGCEREERKKIFHGYPSFFEISTFWIKIWRKSVMGQNKSLSWGVCFFFLCTKSNAGLYSIARQLDRTQSILNLESPALPATTSTLKFASLSTHVGPKRKKEMRNKTKQKARKRRKPFGGSGVGGVVGRGVEQNKKQEKVGELFEREAEKGSKQKKGLLWKKEETRGENSRGKRKTETKKKKNRNKEKEKKKILGGALGHTGGLAEVPDGLTGVAPSTNENGSRPSGAGQCKLVKSQAFSTRGSDASTSGLGEAEGTDGELGDIKKTLIVGNGPDEDSNLSVLSLHEARQLGEGNRGAVGLAHTQPLQDGGVEVAGGSTRHKAVELHQEEEVWVLGLGGSPVAVFRMFVYEIDTHLEANPEKEGKEKRRLKKDVFSSL